MLWGSRLRGFGARRWFILAIGMAWYTWTLMPGVGFEPDTPKFQYLPSVLGIGHPPGYPFYMLVGCLWSWLPFPTIAYGMNLLSAVFAVGALLALDDVMRKLDIDPWVGFPAVVATALTFRFWSYAVVAEVYSVHLFILTMLLRATLDYARKASPRQLVWVLFWGGLAFTHHPLIVTAVPGVVIYLLHVDSRLLLRSWAWRRILPVPFLVFAAYALLGLKNAFAPVYVEDQANTLSGFFDLVFASHYRSAMFIFDFKDLIRERFPFFLGVLSEEWPHVAWVCAAIGMVSLARRRKWDCALVGLALAGNLAFAAQYSITDVDVYVLPSTFLLGIFIAEGWSSVLGGLGKHLPWKQRGVRVAAVLFPAMLSLWFLHANEPWYKRHAPTGRLDVYEGLLKALPDGSLLIPDDFYEEHYLRSFLIGDPRYRQRDLRIASCERNYAEMAEAYRDHDTIEARGVQLDLHAQPVYAFRAIESMEQVGFIFEPVDLPDAVAVTKTLAEAVAEVGPDRLVLFGMVVPELDRETRRTMLEPLKQLGLYGALSVPKNCFTGVGAPGSASVEATERNQRYRSITRIVPWQYFGWIGSGCLAIVQADTDEKGYDYVTFTTPERDLHFYGPSLHAIVLDPRTGRICDYWNVEPREPFAAHSVRLARVVGFQEPKELDIEMFDTEQDGNETGVN